MTGVAGTQRGYSGRIHPANSRMDWFSAFFSLCCIFMRNSLAHICISLINYRLKLDTEWNPTISEMSRIECSVLRNRIQDFKIRVLLT